MNEINEIKIPIEKIEYKPSYEFCSILDYDSALDVTVYHLKTAIVNLIIANTAENENIPECDIQPITEYLNNMLTSGTTIKILKYNHPEKNIMFEFNIFNRITIYQLSKLLSFVIETRCWIQHSSDVGFDFYNKEVKEKFGIRFEKLIDWDL